MSKSLKAPSSWIDEVINIAVVGVGGNGAEVIDSLAMFHTALCAEGGKGLNVVAYDPSDVREVNLVRQRFWPCDINQNKAICIVNRYNLLLGTTWDAEPVAFNPEEHIGGFDLIITACDLPSVRASISKIRMHHKLIWLDIGNLSHHGQAVIGEVGGFIKTKNNYPNVVDHYPEIIDMKDDPSKSCSAAESLKSQSMLMNRFISTISMPLVWSLIKYGEVKQNIVFGDLKNFIVDSQEFE